MQSKLSLKNQRILGITIPLVAAAAAFVVLLSILIFFLVRHVNHAKKLREHDGTKGKQLKADGNNGASSLLRKQNTSQASSSVASMSIKKDKNDDNESLVSEPTSVGFGTEDNNIDKENDAIKTGNVVGEGVLVNEQSFVFEQVNPEGAAPVWFGNPEQNVNNLFAGAKVVSENGAQDLLLSKNTRKETMSPDSEELLPLSLPVIEEEDEEVELTTMSNSVLSVSDDDDGDDGDEEEEAKDRKRELLQLSSKDLLVIAEEVVPLSNEEGFAVTKIDISHAGLPFADNYEETEIIEVREVREVMTMELMMPQNLFHSFPNTYYDSTKDSTSSLSTPTDSVTLENTDDRPITEISSAPTDSVTLENTDSLPITEISSTPTDSVTLENTDSLPITEISSAPTDSVTLENTDSLPITEISSTPTDSVTLENTDSLPITEISSAPTDSVTLENTDSLPIQGIFERVGCVLQEQSISLSMPECLDHTEINTKIQSALDLGEDEEGKEGAIINGGKSVPRTQSTLFNASSEFLTTSVESRSPSPLSESLAEPEHKSRSPSPSSESLAEPEHKSRSPSPSSGSLAEPEHKSRSPSPSSESLAEPEHKSRSPSPSTESLAEPEHKSRSPSPSSESLAEPEHKSSSPSPSTESLAEQDHESRSSSPSSESLAEPGHKSRSSSPSTSSLAEPDHESRSPSPSAESLAEPGHKSRSPSPLSESLAEPEHKSRSPSPSSESLAEQDHESRSPSPSAESLAEPDPEPSFKTYYYDPECAEDSLRSSTTGSGDSLSDAVDYESHDELSGELSDELGEVATGYSSEDKSAEYDSAEELGKIEDDHKESIKNKKSINNKERVSDNDKMDLLKRAAMVLESVRVTNGSEPCSMMSDILKYKHNSNDTRGPSVIQLSLADFTIMNISAQGLQHYSTHSSEIACNTRDSLLVFLVPNLIVVNDLNEITRIMSQVNNASGKREGSCSNDEYTEICKCEVFSFDTKSKVLQCHAFNNESIQYNGSVASLTQKFLEENSNIFTNGFYLSNSSVFLKVDIRYFMHLKIMCLLGVIRHLYGCTTDVCRIMTRRFNQDRVEVKPIQTNSKGVQCSEPLEEAKEARDSDVIDITRHTEEFKKIAAIIKKYMDIVFYLSGHQLICNALSVMQAIYFCSSCSFDEYGQFSDKKNEEKRKEMLNMGIRMMFEFTLIREFNRVKALFNCQVDEDSLQGLHNFVEGHNLINEVMKFRSSFVLTQGQSLLITSIYCFLNKNYNMCLLTEESNGTQYILSTIEQRDYTFLNNLLGLEFSKSGKGESDIQEVTQPHLFSLFFRLYSIKLNFDPEYCIDSDGLSIISRDARQQRENSLQDVPIDSSVEGDSIEDARRPSMYQSNCSLEMQKLQQECLDKHQRKNDPHYLAGELIMTLICRLQSPDCSMQKDLLSFRSGRGRIHSAPSVTIMTPQPHYPTNLTSASMSRLEGVKERAGDVLESSSLEPLSKDHEGALNYDKIDQYGTYENLTKHGMQGTLKSSSCTDLSAFSPVVKKESEEVAL